MKIYQDKEQLEALYNKYKSAYKIAEELNVNYKTIYAWLKKFNIQIQDTSQVARKHTCNYKYFYNIDSPDKAYWLGFLMADGCVYKGDSKNSYRLQINLSAGDRKVLEDFNNAIESDYVITDKIVNGHEVSTLKINSTLLCMDLIDWGVTPRKSLNCEYPEMGISYQYARDFIRGYFDGDGCITVSNRIKWKVSIVGGQSMLNTIQEYLSLNDIASHIYPVRNNIYDLNISSGHSIYKFYKLIYKDNTQHLDRKYDKFQEFLAMYKCPPCE